MKIKFYKVSYEQFLNDFKQVYPNGSLYSEEYIKSIYEAIQLPKRATKGSAGYDFYSPLSFELKQKSQALGIWPLFDDEIQNTITIPTGIRCEMPEDVVLMIYPRSGNGFKSGTSLANTVGIIDSDYYYSDNEGHIMLKFVEGFKKLSLEQGKGLAQGIFIKYLVTEDDEVNEIRNGGFGSTSL